MIRHALELAGEHEVVPVLVPSARAGEVLKKMLMDHVYSMLNGDEHRQAKERAKRIEFIATSTAPRSLAGKPREPLLADHAWHESVAWIFDATQRIRSTVEAPR